MYDWGKLNKILRLVVLVSVLGAVCMSLVDLNGYRNAIAGIPTPRQSAAEGHVRFELDGYQVRIGYMYHYDIEALVVHTKNYSGWDIGDKLGPKDAALAWGRVAENNKNIDFHWDQNNRRVSWSISPDVEERVFGFSGASGLEISNNHLIPADMAVKWKIKQIRTGDHIRITGYLADVVGYRSDRNFTWKSSTVRTDTGDGACEVIYVTDVEWL